MPPVRQPAPELEEDLEPGLLRVIEALARAHAREDYAALQAIQEPA